LVTMHQRLQSMGLLLPEADQLGGADGGGEGVTVAGSRIHVGCGVSELDHVLVAVLDGPGEGLLGRLRPARRVRQFDDAG